MNKSIKRQIATIFIALVVAIMLVSMLLNSQFLERYYVYNKQETLIDVYEKMEKAVAATGASYENMAEELSALTETANMMFVIVSGDNQRLLSSTANQWQTEEMRSQLVGYLLNINQDKGELLAETKEYQIRSAVDVVSGNEHIEMWGHLSDGSTFLIRSPLESIRENVMLSNRFLIYIMLGMTALGCVFVWYFAKRIADPILELAQISKRMADLDFDVKYTSGGKNEIGVLGENFNAMSQKLEQTVSELKSANYELQKDIEKKEKMETMRSEFIANVSHELKTPIALIQGYAEGLKEGISDDPESRAFYCDVIMDEASKMNALVKNLLTLNQLEVGEEEVQFARFDVMQLIRGVVQSCDIFIQQKNADVRVDAEQAVFVWADEWKVEQVFRNYFSNALNHLEGEQIIDVRVEEQPEAGTVRISVFNTGAQIPEEELTQIWNKFYKVDKARTREYGGNGIGLSIVKAIMDSFHKDYGVKNYNNGVQFWFELDVR
ncbi:MAG: HAMP domain-containing sensor histidine kinase [Faecalimonas sp.]|nr:HAMP domain-containing sensor histidine kinase [Faecalimonas sp.]